MTRPMLKICCHCRAVPVDPGYGDWCENCFVDKRIVRVYGLYTTKRYPSQSKRLDTVAAREPAPLKYIENRTHAPDPGR